MGPAGPDVYIVTFRGKFGVVGTFEIKAYDLDEAWINAERETIGEIIDVKLKR